MRGLIKKLFIPAIIVGTLLSKNSFAQEKKEPVKKTYFSVALDSYKDTDEDVNERYGLIPGVKFGITTDISKNKRIETSFSLFRKTGEIGNIGNSTMGIYLSDLSLFYVHHSKDKNNFAVYAGGGPAYVYASESGEINFAGMNSRASLSGSGLGLKLSGGMEFSINKFLKGYAQLSTVPVVSGDLTNLKMSFLEAGIRF